MIDTHCHLDFDHFDEDREQVIARALEAGLTAMITIGVDLATSQNAIALAEAHDAVYATVGIHPNNVASAGLTLEETIGRLRDLAAHPKVVAIGECGLDYYWDKAPRDQQAEWFTAQLDLCSELAMPVVIHNRESTDDVLAVLQAWREGDDRPLPGVLHSFSGTWDEGAQAAAMGFFLGITGPITFKNASRNRRIAANLPADHMLIETDAPFLTPHPHRGERNEPAYVRFVAERIAGVRGESTEAVAEQTTRNARRLFRLGDAG
ncbi:MAG: TatD family hydrolase [Chloroflexi bacterium]|nr:TatD family hydrolase [Chloroflexota bacterium]